MKRLVPLALKAQLRPHFFLVNDCYVFNHYLLLTVYGYLLASTPGSWQWFAQRRHQFAIGDIAVYVAATLLFEQASFIATHRSMRSLPISSPGGV